MKIKEQAREVLNTILADLSAKGTDPKVVKKAFLLGTTQLRQARTKKVEPAEPAEDKPAP